MTRVAVVGAGLAGLSCAHSLRRAGREVVVLEAGSRAGGVVGTLAAEGFRFETGPHTVPPSSFTFLRLCDELGLAERLTPSSPRARNRYLFWDGRLVAAPLGPPALLSTPLLSWRGKRRLLSEPLRRLRPLPADAPEPTLAAFLEERLGPEATRRMAAAFVRGVYAGEIDRLGARSAFPRLWRLAEEHGGLVRGMLASRKKARESPAPPRHPRGRLLSFPGGFAELVDALAASLGPALRTGTEVRALARSNRRYVLELAGGERLDAARVVLATPARATARLLAPLAPTEVPEALRRIEHASVAVAHLGFDAGALDPPPDGFGFLVPPGVSDAPEALGMIFVTNLFPERSPGGAFAVTGIYRKEPGVEVDSGRAAAVACADLALALGRARPPEPRVVRTLGWDGVIPQYGVGHRERVIAIERAVGAALPGLLLAGTWSGGVSVEDVLARGRATAERLVAEEAA